MQSCKDIPAVKDMLATAQKVLGYDLLNLCLEGPKEKLDDTAYRCCAAPHAQAPAALLHSMLCLCLQGHGICCIMDVEIQIVC